MSPACTVEPGAASSFPRVSGDEPRAVERNIALVAFSPRERG